MEYVTLNNGIKMPKLGYGVYQTPPEDTSAVSWMPLISVTEALIPHRHIIMKRVSVPHWQNVVCPVKSSS